VNDKNRVWAKKGWELVHSEHLDSMDVASTGSEVHRMTVPGGWLVRYTQWEGKHPDIVLFIAEPKEET